MSMASKRVARLEQLNGHDSGTSVTCIVRSIVDAKGSVVRRIVRPLGGTPEERDANLLAYEAETRRAG